MTAPDRIWAPISDPFSSTQTLTSRPSAAASCLSWMAADRPAGPPPTMTTSYSMLSRSVTYSFPGVYKPRPPSRERSSPFFRFLDEGQNIGDAFLGIGGGDVVGVALQH